MRVVKAEVLRFAGLLLTVISEEDVSPFRKRNMSGGRATAK
ncbi:hypothetical protein [Paenibacillus sp. MBLB4367]